MISENPYSTTLVPSYEKISYPILNEVLVLFNRAPEAKVPRKCLTTKSYILSWGPDNP